MVTYTLFHWLHVQPLPPILFALILLDIMTGLVAAFITKQASSIASYNGAGRKSLILLIVGACAIIDPLAGGFPVFKGACLFYIFSEMLSIIKNCARAGVPFPKGLLDALVELQAKQILPQPQHAQTIQNTFNNGPSTIQIVPDSAIPASSQSSTQINTPAAPLDNLPTTPTSANRGDSTRSEASAAAGVTTTLEKTTFSMNSTGVAHYSPVSLPPSANVSHSAGEKPETVVK